MTTKSFPVPVQSTLKVAPSYLVCYQNPVGNGTQEQCYNKDNLSKNLIKEKNTLKPVHHPTTNKYIEFTVKPGQAYPPNSMNEFLI